VPDLGLAASTCDLQLKLQRYSNTWQYGTIYRTEWFEGIALLIHWSIGIHNDTTTDRHTIFIEGPVEYQLEF
jgi:hypothetical protein